MKRKIGLIVNPVAGMGGSVGLKGTDGDMGRRSREMGARPVTPFRTADLLSALKCREEIEFFAAPGPMGADYVHDLGVDITEVGSIGAETTARDTIDIAGCMRGLGVDLIIFVGGDGTARNMCDAVGLDVPVVGVPSGVKVFSPVFSTSARAAASLVDAFVAGSDLIEQEVMDIDEDIFRQGRLAARLYGYMKVPRVAGMLQGEKRPSTSSASSEANKKEIAGAVLREMDEETLYLLGPGTTVKAVADEIGVPKTLLGVDAVYGRALEGRDINEKEILDLIARFPKRKIVVTMLGGNGFIFGRGNRQFTPEVIRQVGRENIIVVGEKDKVHKVNVLRVDTGDTGLDDQLCGFIRVWIGYNEDMIMKVVS